MAKKNKSSGNNNHNTNQQKLQPNQKHHQHQRTQSLDETTQTRGKGKLSASVTTHQKLSTPAEDSCSDFTRGEGLLVTPSSPTTKNIDFSAAFEGNLLSPKDFSIFDLIAAVILRIFTSKRFWTFLLCIAFYFAYYNQVEITAVGMKYYPKGLQIEEEGRPGLSFNTSRIKVQRPILIIPGFVTTGLDLWSGEECMLSDVRTNFRQRLFGPSMILKLLQDPACYLRHMALDPETGADPSPRIKVRHDTGMDAVDYIDRSGVYWVWAKLMRNLADIGYEPKNMHVAGYDWRMDPELAEERYGFFSRLKKKIEGIYDSSEMTTARVDSDEDETNNVTPASPPGRHKQEKQKIVMVCHSYGMIMAREFLNFCDKTESGWTDRYIHSIIGNGGAHLGIPKANAALMSGEMKDTASLPTIPRRIFDSHLLRRTRANAFRTWPCLHAMMTRGSDKLFPEIIEFTESVSSSVAGSFFEDASVSFSALRNSEAVNALERLAKRNSETIKKAFSMGREMETEKDQLEELRDQQLLEKEIENEKKSSYWSNKKDSGGEKEKRKREGDNNKNDKNEAATPFEGKKLNSTETIELIRQVAVATNRSRLIDHITRTEKTRQEIPQFPKAKSVQLFCVYGVGLNTEVGYYYKQPIRRHNATCGQNNTKKNTDTTNDDYVNPRTRLEQHDEALIREYDLESIEFDLDQTTGVRVGDGDGTVPLMSLGYPCRSKKFGFSKNLGKVTTVEMKNIPAPLDPRGGVHSGDHVDGMGNYDFIDVVLKVVSGLEDEVEERIESDIDERIKDVEKDS